jgi:hypothetical protein
MLLLGSRITALLEFRRTIRKYSLFTSATRLLFAAYLGAVLRCNGFIPGTGGLLSQECLTVISKRGI